ncbi:MAG: hypothetical protein WCI55_15465 [Armatimonadota bacterium]|jgi:hypothetical protein
MSFFSDSSSDELLSTLTDILVKTAGSGRQSTITFSDLADKCASSLSLPSIDFSDPAQRKDFSLLLGMIADASYREHGFLLTAIVDYKSNFSFSTKEVNPGMREAMVRNGLAKNSDSDDKLQTVIWAQMKKIWEHYGTIRRDRK